MNSGRDPENRRMYMNNTGKIIITLLVLVYVLSPNDLAPGPIDDILIMMLGHALKHKKEKSL